MPPVYDDYIGESGFGRVSTLGSNDPTILEDVEFMMLLKIIMREEHMLVGIAIMSSFPSMC